MTQQHLITKTDLRETKWIDAAEAPLAAGDVRLRVDNFALTANNVTYAAFGGPPMNYWHFFPTQDAGQGRVPVWGFATIIASNNPEITVGHRVYGYFPISETLDVTPARVNESGFFDSAAHRAELAPIYNNYVYTHNDPVYREDLEAEQMLFRPLYMTGWLICDCLMAAEAKPSSVIISSASSKTALATAHSLKQRGMHTVGITSPGNVDYVKSSGLYDEVVTYDGVPDMSPRGPCAYVDFVGRPSLTSAIHAATGEHLLRSLIIGATDWEADRAPTAPPVGPKPEMFFAPGYVATRSKELERGALQMMMGKDIIASLPISKAFVTPESINGRDAIAQAWRDSVDGKVAPNRGLICSF